MINTDSSRPFQILFEAVVGDGSLGHIALDEISIHGVTCYQTEISFLCDNSNCIPETYVCDDYGTVDCIDGTDEAEATCCDPLTKFRCNNGRCIDNTQLCDGFNDCSIGEREDETNCPGTSTATSLSTRSEYKPLTTMPEKGYSTFPTKPGTSTATSLSTRSEYKPLTTMPEKGYSTFPTKPDISMPLSVTRPGTARTSTSTGAIVGAVIGCIFATSILWILAIIVWKKVCKKTKPSLNTSTQLGDNGYVEYKANTQEPYAELTASSTSGSKQNESTRNTQPVIGEDGYTEYNRRRQQESFEELQKSTSPDTKGTSTSDTDYEVHIDITHGATPAEAKHAKEEKPEVTSIKHRSAEVSHENNDDNEYSYAYADVPKTDASDMNNQNKQVPFSNGNNDESSGTYVNSSVVRKMP
ncbi:uncharacterized protein [Amphiura filiformis]|uniref:uncharacterized protein isoform X1 n=1 Tax=Amphiura filiformis TaxID=82378 RepID=UPI003B216398